LADGVRQLAARRARLLLERAARSPRTRASGRRPAAVGCAFVLERWPGPSLPDLHHQDRRRAHRHHQSLQRRPALCQRLSGDGDATGPRVSLHARRRLPSVDRAEGRMIWREKRILLIVLGVLLLANTIFFFTYRVQYVSRLEDLDA